MKISASQLLAGVLFLCPLFIQGAQAAAIDEACYHNIVRDALNKGKTMNNLGPRLDQSYDFSRQNQPAQHLPKLSVNAAMRDSAAAWARQCRFDHSGWIGKGENLFVGSETYLNPAEWASKRKWSIQNAVNDWAYEARLLTIGPEVTSCIGGASECGHYTQMVWDDTTLVGCAEQFCPTVTQNGQPIFGGKQSTLVVCHYSPQGNYVPYSGGPYLAPYDIGGHASLTEAQLSDCSSSVGGPIIDLMSAIRMLL